ERAVPASPRSGAAVASPCIREAGRRGPCMANTYTSDTAIELKRANPDAVPSPDTYRPSRDPDSLSELFTPDIVLPEQFFEGARRDSYISGEKALMLAVLEDGIRCFQEHLRNPRSNPRLLSQQAEQWIRAVDYEWPFSFQNVCETLGINPESLRGALLGALDRVALGVEQAADLEQHLDVLAAVEPVPRPRLAGPEDAELRLPVAQHVRLHADQLRDLADLEVEPVGQRDGAHVPPLAAGGGPPPFIVFLSTWLALKVRTRRPEMTISSPVCGFRPLRGRFSFTTKLPKPEILTFSPC